MIFHVLLVGFPPFDLVGENINQLYHQILHKPIEEECLSHKAFNTVSPQAKGLLSRILTREVPWRISAEEALAHEFLAPHRTQHAGGGAMKPELAVAEDEADVPHQLVRGSSYHRLVEFNTARQSEAKRRWGKLKMALQTVSTFLSQVESQVVEERRATMVARESEAEAEHTEARLSAEAVEVRREMAALQATLPGAGGLNAGRPGPGALLPLAGGGISPLAQGSTVAWLQAGRDRGGRVLALGGGAHSSLERARTHEFQSS